MNLRNLAIWGVVIVVAIGLYGMVTQTTRAGGGASGEVTYSDLLHKHRQRPRQEGGDLWLDPCFHGLRHRRQRPPTRPTPPPARRAIKHLEGQNADIQVKSPGGNIVLGVLLNLAPVDPGSWQMTRAGDALQMCAAARGGPWASGKVQGPPADRVQEPGDLDDVAGVDERPRKELAEIVDFGEGPRLVPWPAARFPKATLMVGPPGTGKTLLGRAGRRGGRALLNPISGSDFVEMFVGVGYHACATCSNRPRRTRPASSNT